MKATVLSTSYGKVGDDCHGRAVVQIADDAGKVVAEEEVTAYVHWQRPEACKRLVELLQDEIQAVIDANADTAGSEQAKLDAVFGTMDARLKDAVAKLTPAAIEAAKGEVT